ncbi:thioredoxin [Winogradskyella sp. J14-2]|uniref:TlpA family protein disulfide reductase n=1 Tax=Winogradskyella sp. J14-2 TaxID=1936080 RepID=UPI00097268F0|nr:TlpA disulfide reductase family protein [Winogradskyella sp. J14-2]APY07742.1 thioredoxin [Winogradskyella sp. J14-2]
MKRLIILSLLIICSCNNKDKDVSVSDKSKSVLSTEKKTENTVDFDLEIYDYDGLEPLINKNDNKVHVVNFWATWCAPCVKELPYFEEINQEYKDKNVEVLLVSLDFPRNYESKLIPFVAKRNLQSEVVAFDDVDQNRWITAIHKDWSGAIPATIIYNKEKRQFYERSFTKEELETELKQFLN